jgi:hypothetical protein
MPKPAQSLSWQHMRRLLESKSKNELLNLLRDLYALTTDNKDLGFPCLSQRQQPRRKTV